VIIENFEPFSEVFNPVTLSLRHRYIEELRADFEAFRRGAPLRVLVYGNPGTGKTLVLKFLYNEYSQVGRIAYVDCTKFRTATDILENLFLQLGKPVAVKGKNPSSFLPKLEKLRPIVVLDEADFIENKSFVYSLLKAEGVGVVLITNNASFLAFNEPSVMGLVKMVRFRPYSPGELREIIRERAYAAFGNRISPEAVGKIAGFAAKYGGNARLAIYLLFEAAKLAERFLTTEEVEKAKERLYHHILGHYLSKLSEEEQKVCLLALERGYITVKDVAELFDYSERQVRNLLASLVEKNILVVERRALGRRNVQVFRLSFLLE
jgi:Cdc6-like AAA superfamily ATPase